MYWKIRKFVHLKQCFGKHFVEISLSIGGIQFDPDLAALSWALIFILRLRHQSENPEAILLAAVKSEIFRRLSRDGAANRIASGFSD